MSLIIYKQQIVRALTSDYRATLLTLDVVNNFEGLQSVSAIHKETEVAVGAMRQNVECDSIATEQLEFGEHVHGCARLFEVW